MAAELVRLNVDVIAAAGTLAPLAAKHATATIPIVMLVAGDPLGSGPVANLARPGAAAEQGFAGLVVVGSIGLLAPAGTPIDIIEQIARATRMAVAEPAYRQMLIEPGIEPTIDSNLEKFRQSLAADVALWRPGRQHSWIED